MAVAEVTEPAAVFAIDVATYSRLASRIFAADQQKRPVSTERSCPADRVGNQHAHADTNESDGRRQQQRSQ
jgi:hypothetical protein